jgi:hypothetical protein
MPSIEPSPLASLLRAVVPKVATLAAKGPIHSPGVE